jgi:hypothetical protein
MWGKLAKELGVQELPEGVRTELLAEYEDLIDHAIGTGELEDLVRQTRSLYRVFISPRGSSRKSRKILAPSGDSWETTPAVGQYEGLRAAIVSDYLAKMVAIDPDVMQFRKDVLDSELLTPEEAHAFLSSPATRFLDHAVWQTYGIPAKHTANLLDENFGRTADGPFHWVRIQINPPAEEHAEFIPNPQGYNNVTYLAEGGRPRRVTFRPASVLGKLHKLCKALTKSHPWNIDEATWFVLTSERPTLQPIRAKINSSWTPGTRAHTTISLTIQPWVSPETVEAAYRQIQKEVIGGECGRIGDKNLKLLEFVTNRADANGNLPKGEVLVQEWDKERKRKHPEWCYDGDKRRLWRDFRSVQRSLTNSRRAGLFLDGSAYSPEEYIPQS